MLNSLDSIFKSIALSTLSIELSFYGLWEVPNRFLKKIFNKFYIVRESIPNRAKCQRHFKNVSWIWFQFNRWLIFVRFLILSDFFLFNRSAFRYFFIIIMNQWNDRSNSLPFIIHWYYWIILIGIEISEIFVFVCAKLNSA